MPLPHRRLALALGLLAGSGAGLPGAAVAAPDAVPPPVAVAAPAPPPADQARLVHTVREDCGSCHGMRLTGGLGPALTPDRMSLLPLDSLVAVILHGRPGTPMPPWAPMLSEAEARWIALRLQQGFPQEPPRP